ncbi:hypothetical protein [Dactylosporangium salmoneum]|uniref:Adhesin domain-containing protein n=1 Tax=Dactylosporangium salmoneum TaxID=53361 RepID=A0ABN3I6U4_9ACTN
MTALDAPPRPRPRTVYLAGGLILAAILLTGVLVAVSQHHDPTVTGAVDGRNAATLDLLSGVGAVTVRAADLGDTLYRIQSPRTATAHDTGDRVEVRVDGGDASVTVELNRDVRWTLRFTAGSQSNTADLRGLRRLAGVEYVGGVSAIDLALPGPSGTVPVRVDGGASTLRVHAPDEAAVRVRAGGGAGGVSIDGATHSGVTAGATYATGGWDAAADRFDVDAAGGISSITLDRN